MVRPTNIVVVLVLLAYVLGTSPSSWVAARRFAAPLLVAVVALVAVDGATGGAVLQRAHSSFGTPLGEGLFGMTLGAVGLRGDASWPVAELPSLTMPWNRTRGVLLVMPVVVFGFPGPRTLGAGGQARRGLGHRWIARASVRAVRSVLAVVRSRRSSARFSVLERSHARMVPRDGGVERARRAIVAVMVRDRGVLVGGESSARGLWHVRRDTRGRRRDGPGGLADRRSADHHGAVYVDRRRGVAKLRRGPGRRGADLRALAGDRAWEWPRMCLAGIRVTRRRPLAGRRRVATLARSDGGDPL